MELENNLLTKLSPRDSWVKAYFWSNLSYELTASFKNKNELVDTIKAVFLDLNGAIEQRNVAEVERISLVIEGNNEEDSWLTKSYYFDKDSQDWHLFGLVMETISLSINTLYISKDVKNVPGWFREDLNNGYSDIVSLANNCEVINVFESELSKFS